MLALLACPHEKDVRDKASLQVSGFIKLCLSSYLKTLPPAET